MLHYAQVGGSLHTFRRTFEQSQDVPQKSILDKGAIKGPVFQVLEYWVLTLAVHQNDLGALANTKAQPPGHSNMYPKTGTTVQSTNSTVSGGNTKDVRNHWPQP